jgi:hypothetical protein
MAEEFAPGTFYLGGDAFTGSMTKMHITPDGKMHIENIYQVDEIIERAKAERNEVSRTAKLGDMVKVASLPMHVHLDLMERGIIGDKTAMRRWLASEEAAPYRTHWIKS